MLSKRPAFILFLFLAAAFASACDRGDMAGDKPDDEYLNPGGEGPEVLFEPDADPIPLLPQPNNLLAKKDDTTSTGLRVNIPVEGETDFVRTLRERMRGMDGFGDFANVAVSFSMPIDLETIGDDTVYLVNVQRDSEFYGEITPVDLGKGYYPKSMIDPEGFYPHDKFADAENVIFPPENRVEWYEDETNTLLIRPLYPLHQQCKYATVLTTGLKGEDGHPVRPPDYFKYVTFPTQTRSLSDAAKILAAKKGLNPDDIAFSWEFTTATITEPIEYLRRGLYGDGPFGWIADELPPQISVIHDFSTELDNDSNDKIFSAALFKQVVELIATFIPETGSVPVGIMIPMDHLEYLVSGTYPTLSFLETSDRVFHMDYKKGAAEYGPEEVTFFIAIPKTTAEHKPPFPVCFFQHANIRNRLDIIALADYMAEQGVATIGIDAAEHGPESYVIGAVYALEGFSKMDIGPVADLPVELIVKLLVGIFYPSIDLRGKSSQELVQILENKTFFGAMLHGRSIDEDGDGLILSGNTFYSADIFRTVDISRQTIFDLFQGVKMVKSLGTDWNGNGKIDLEEGDFNGDGVLDLGGPDNPIYFVGMSLGSIIGIPFVSMEPEIKSAVFNVPGGGLTDVLMRTTIPNVNAAIRADLTGPVAVGRLDAARGDVALTINNEAMDLAFSHVVFSPGSRVILENVDSGKTVEGEMDESGNFALAAAADKGDYMRLTVVDKTGGDVMDQVEWASRYRGFGVQRNTPLARSFIDTAQWAVGLSDPISYAPFLAMYPRPGMKPKNFLMQHCSPDGAIPLSAGASISRAAGVMDEAHSMHLIEQGGFERTRVSFKNANLPIQSYKYQAWRVFPAYNHEFMLAPRYDPYAIMYSISSRAQAARFLVSDGYNLVDTLETLVPPEYLVDPLDPDWLP